MTPEQRLAELVEGRSEKLILRMKSGFAVLGDTQFLPGYSLLLAYPMVAQLNDLTGDDRAQFLADMAALGDVVMAATGCIRINYSVYGNLDPFLHAHVWPRYPHEGDAYRTAPPFNYPAEIREAPAVQFALDRDGAIMERIRRLLSDN
jgi:diadenosine tetraphosphate (Ap4A) HIT family hydrolase